MLFRSDLWTGTTTSEFTLAGARVKVRVACDAERDLLAVRIESPLVAGKRLGVRLAIPRGYDPNVKNNPALDWSAPDSHTTRILAQNASLTVVEHLRDEARYLVSLLGSGPLDARWVGQHEFRLGVAEGEVLEFVVGFSPTTAHALPAAEAVFKSSAAAWAQFWQAGGAVEIGRAHV